MHQPINPRQDIYMGIVAINTDKGYPCRWCPKVLRDEQGQMVYTGEFKDPARIS